MTIEERKQQSPKEKPHQLVLENRKKLKLTGVTDVKNFSDTAVTADTCMGNLTIKGDGLKISKLNTDDGELTVDGKINALEYAVKKEKGSFFESIFK